MQLDVKRVVGGSFYLNQLVVEDLQAGFDSALARLHFRQERVHDRPEHGISLLRQYGEAALHDR